MTRFPASAIRMARQVNEANLPDSCTATTPGGEWIPDGEGGGHWGGETVETFPCRTWPLNPRQMETLVADQLREPGLEGLVMPAGQRLAPNATVKITRADGEVQRYEVRGRVPDPTYSMMSRAIIRRLPEES